MIDHSALKRLKAAKSSLTRQQYKTLRGQVLAGDAEGAMRGLQKCFTNTKPKGCGGVRNE